MRTQSMDTSPEAERVLVSLLRNAALTKRFGLVRSLTTVAARANQQNIKKRDPHINQEEIAVVFSQSLQSKTCFWFVSALKHRTTLLTSDLLEAITSIAKTFEQLGIAYYLRVQLQTRFTGCSEHPLV